MARRYHKRDANHAEIVKELEKRGIQALDLSGSGAGVTDIVTYYLGNTVFIEIKIKQVGAKLKKSQMWFLGSWRGHCGIATTIDEAVDLAAFPGHYGLNKKQKEFLLGLWHTTKAKEVRFPELKIEIDALRGAQTVAE